MAMQNCTKEISANCSNSGVYIALLSVNISVAVLGIVTNIINALIFSDKTFHSSSFVYLRFVSIVDLLYCILTCLSSLMKCNYTKVGTFLRFFYVFFLCLPLVNTFAACSIWTALAMSVERLSLIRFPIVARHLATRRDARTTIIIIAFIASVLHVPYFFRFFINDKFQMKKTLFGSYGFNTYNLIRNILVKFIPIITLIILNTAMLKALFDVSKRRKQMVVPLGIIRHSSTNITSIQKRDSTVTRMILTITTVFVLCHVWEPLTNRAVFQKLFGICSTYKRSFSFFVMACNILEAVSFSANMFIYLIFNSHFRKVGIAIITCRKYVPTQEQTVSSLK